MMIGSSSFDTARASILMFEQVEGDMAQDGEGLSTMRSANLAAIFTSSLITVPARRTNASDGGEPAQR